MSPYTITDYLIIITIIGIVLIEIGTGLIRQYKKNTKAKKTKKTRQKNSTNLTK